jgi:hypothetical protein
MSFFIGLGAVLINNLMEKELVILGLKRITGGHSAENVKAKIEEIVNQYRFDKKNIQVNLA